ncbi:phosphohydrolase [Acidovorax sp. JG5]|nr:HD domain-containing phosphohydrolase [Acidovorax sp. JG5]MBP3980526.1 phosphohydrolase [Acidovorax sp. JG5]
MDAPLPWNVRNHDCTLLLARGHVISSETQMQALLERGMYVDLEEKRAVEALASPKPAPTKSIYVHWTDAIDTLESLLHNLPDAPDFLAKIDALAQELITLAELDADIAIFMAVRQDQARHLRYGFSHSVYTALLTILMAQRMEWTTANIRLVTLAALTMNASIADLQGQMASQDYPMLDRQRVQLRAHPFDSAALLAQAGITDTQWLNAVRQHHEQANGKGYPTGTTQISELAQMLRMADVFMARISPRVIRPPMSVQDAARQMFRDDKGGAMSSAIIKVLGIYPPGNLVKLASGELGVVMRRGAEARTPLVAAVTDAQGRSVTTTLHRNTAEPAFAITGPATNDKNLLARVPPERLYGYAQRVPSGPDPSTHRRDGSTHDG